ncbi:MAG: hypothetical protein IIA00_02940 [Proteobacteria bacterium]|nr:hypothetical protein [Pseudomonadota bacterium]
METGLMAALNSAYTLRFGATSEASLTKDQAMALARSQNMTLREFILSALVHERERLQHTPLADDGPLTDEQIAWLRAQFPESFFAGEEQLGPSLW